MILLFHREAVLRGHGDFFESVVFHSSYEVSCFLGCVGCLLVFWLGCLVFVLAVCLCWLLLFVWMGDTLGIVSLLFSCVGMDNLNQWIDDRQSFERARHPQKKKT